MATVFTKFLIKDEFHIGENNMFFIETLWQYAEA